MKAAGVIRVFGLFVLLRLVIVSDVAVAEDEPERTIVIKDHQFAPAQVEVPAGVRVKLVIDNQDTTAEEFESHGLRSEKLVPGSSKAIIWIGPLQPGEYEFVGEFHQDSARGRVVAK